MRLSQFLWESAYIAPQVLACFGAAVWLFATRRRAPKAYILGAFTFVGLGLVQIVRQAFTELVFNGFGPNGSGRIDGPTAIMAGRFAWTAAGLAHAAGFGLLAWAIVRDRPPPPE